MGEDGEVGGDLGAVLEVKGHVGVVEVNQVATSRDAVRRGYLMFMEQMAELVGSSDVF